MKTKLTLSVDADLVPRAKAHARELGLSLSSVVEDQLRSLVGESGPGFVERWAGRFTRAERDDPRTRALVAKYLREGGAVEDDSVDEGSVDEDSC